MIKNKIKIKILENLKLQQLVMPLEGTVVSVTEI